MVPGLNQWCRNHGISGEISKALSLGVLGQDDVNRLKEIVSEGKGAEKQLSDKQKSQHKLKDLSIHRSKNKDGSLKIFWPKDSPTANTFGGKGKGSKSSSNSKGDKGKGKKGDKKAASRKVWFGGEPATELDCPICDLKDPIRNH